MKSLWQLFFMSIKIAVRERRSLFNFWKDFVKSDPLGHAAVDTYPDQPYLDWQYENWQKTTIKCDNPARFTEAVDMMVRAMRAWRANDASMNLSNHQGITTSDAKVVEDLFRNLTDPRGEVRHEQWLNAISSGRFSFGPQSLSYIGKDKGSWKEVALRTAKATDTGLELFTYSSSFLYSDWKLFHDALQTHRSDVVHDILPKYGICAA
jgi:hypothetical protein